MVADLSIRPEEIDWRVGATFEVRGVKHGTLLGYIDSRLAMDKLDLLDSNWSSRMEPITLNGEQGIRCTLTVNGISREDVGVPSNTEPLKGAFSDALKRAAVHFGIGRELYDLPHIAVQVEVKANGKVGRPLALPEWRNGRWTIDSKLGWVRYDREPETPHKPAEAPRRVTTAPTERQQLKERIAEALAAHGRNLDYLNSVADRVGAHKPATREQLVEMLAIIESPQEPTSSDDQGQDQPAPPAAPSPDPVLDAVLAQTGGTVVAPDDGLQERIDRANARAKAAPRGARETAEPEPLTTGLAS